MLQLINDRDSQVFDITTKIIKDNVDKFADFFCKSINNTFKSSVSILFKVSGRATFI